MSRSDVVRRLRALASRGVPISVRYLLPAHADLVGQALAIFGSFDRARAVAGLPAPALEPDVDVIIGALRSLARSGVRLDVATLSTMGESTLVSACVEAFGSVAAAASRAGIAATPSAPEPRASGGGGGGARGPQPGFAQPPLSPDGQVSTETALEVLQKTALQLGRVPAARDLPPDVARRLTTDYGSVRFAYLALRIHAEGQTGQRTAESAAQAAAEPVAVVSQEALAATARMPDQVAVHRRNVEARETRPAASDDDDGGDDDGEPPPAGGPDEDAWAAAEARIDAAATAAGEQLRAAIGAMMDDFVAEVTELARHATLSALIPRFPDEEEE